MASKEHIKDTIKALCKIILHNGGTKISPEQFRLAKFDKNEVGGVMWKLLFETVWFQKYDTFRTTEDFNSEQHQNLISWTKRELFERGYYVKDFYDLPDDMSRGSREILLAFGWLMSRSKLIHLFIDKCNDIFEECLPTDWGALITSQSHPSSSKKSEKNSKFSNKTDESINIDQISWMVGNLMLSWKGLFTAENQLASLVGKVHSATQGANAPKGHLSALEVFLLQHPKELARFIEKVQHYNSYLELLLQFVEMQDIFWQWLESVYEAKVLATQGAEGSTWNGREPCRSCQEISDEKLSSIWNIQVEIQEAIHESEKHGSIAKQKLDALENRESICQLKLHELNKKMLCLTLNENPQSKHAGILETFPELKHDIANVKQSQPSCAQQEIGALKVKLTQVELKLEELRNEHFDILNNLVENLEDSVFIPPIANSKYTELRNK